MADQQKDRFSTKLEDSEQLLVSKRYNGWEITHAYWQSAHRFRNYFIFAIILVMTIAMVGLDVVFNYWYNYFYNALQAYDYTGVIDLLKVFFAIAFVYIIVAVFRYYVSQIFGLKWRKWLTDQFVARWLSGRSYYLLENFDDSTDNPDQRIQEDVGSLVNFSLDLTIGLIGAVATFFAFIFVLWKLSGELILPLGSLGTYHIPGYLVWVGLLYAFIGTMLTFKIGRPLVGLNFEQQRREATFRFAAMDLRQHAEHVALYKGEGHQRSVLKRLFDRVIDNWYMIVLRQKKLLWFTAGYNQISVVLPLIVALPNYFDKVFLLGGLIQSLQAFGKVQDSLSFIVNAYPRIAEWQAVLRRLTTFINHIHEAEEKAKAENQLKIEHTSGNQIAVHHVSINTPRNEALLKDINENFVHGEHYLIKGRSGIGKSTFLRALAGIWPYTKGEMDLPSQQKVMFLSQKPYMPMGTLAEAILFPNGRHPEMESRLEDVLRKCNLASFIPRLHDSASWSQQLSPGEQQRIAFARVFLHRPDWVFMDESTSMLDMKNEEHLYGLMKTELPNCSIISVGHRASLDAHHTHVVNMEKYSVQAV